MAFEKLFFLLRSEQRSHRHKFTSTANRMLRRKERQRQQHIDCGLTIEGWGGLSEYKRQFNESHSGGTFARQSLFRFALDPAISRVNEGNLLRQQV